LSSGDPAALAQSGATALVIVSIVTGKALPMASAQASPAIVDNGIERRGSISPTEFARIDAMIVLRL
jgi:hypothetical protein